MLTVATLMNYLLVLVGISDQQSVRVKVLVALRVPVVLPYDAYESV